MNLQDKLQELRKENNFSQEQLADALGISRQSVSKWESGQATPDVEKIVRISELYNVTTDYLLKEAPADLPTVSAKLEVPDMSTPRHTFLMKYDFSLLLAVIATISGFVGTISLWVLSSIFPVVVQNVSVNSDGQYMLVDQILPGFFPFLEQRGLELIFGICFAVFVTGVVMLYQNAQKRKIIRR